MDLVIDAGMRSKLRYIILVSDNDERADIMTKLIKEISSSVKIDLAQSFRQLTLLIAKKLPDLIVMHFRRSDNGYAGFLGKVRKNKKLDKVPVLIYPNLPDNKEFTALLKQLGKV